MDILRIRETNLLRPLQLVFICLVAAIVGASCLTLSAAKAPGPIDGALPWTANSPLYAVVRLLCLGYEFPTVNPGDVKVYILGVGAALALISLGVAWMSPTSDERSVSRGSMPSPSSGTPESKLIDRLHVTPLAAGKILLLLFLLWSLVSARWSVAPHLAVGASVLLAIHIMWALGIGLGLNPTGVRYAGRAIIVVTALTSATALWYYYGRNPNLRAKFPFGNPTFLAACLIPGILLSAFYVIEMTISAVRRPRVVAMALGLAGLASLTAAIWALALTESRGAALGLVFAVISTGFFAARRKWKIIPVLSAFAIVIVLAVYALQAKDTPSAQGRDATLRFRLYAWDYAWQMLRDKPLTGYGQGGFTLLGDSFVADDVLDDPKPFTARIAHVHNEWLEILADLGVVGLALIGLSLLLTIRVGMLALRSPPAGEAHWTMVALLGALVGLIVEEASGVGLRVSGVGTLFYTVIGLIWAGSAASDGSLMTWLARSRRRHVGGGVVMAVFGVGVMLVTQEDFSSARADYQVNRYLEEGRFDDAIALASVPQMRLNTQRALTNLFRRAEAHQRVAERLQREAVDRESRARQQLVPDRKLLVLAQNGYLLSHEHCKTGSAILKTLVSQSPGFFNHGRLECRLNLTMAGNPAAAEQQEQYLGAAKAAIERELVRQPFDPATAVEYVRVAGANSKIDHLVAVLARPLRYERMIPDYLNLLGWMAQDPAFDSSMESIITSAQDAIRDVIVGESTRGPTDRWTPEILRIAAASYFIRGDYDRARSILESVVLAYEELAVNAVVARASCYAELADCRFFAEPDAVEPALAAAEQSVELAPPTWQGRRLAGIVKQRMVNYLVAAARESDAITLLRQSGGPNVSESAVRHELGLRYRKVVESVLSRREADVYRKPPESLLPKLRRWIARAIELSPEDVNTHLVAADLAFYADDESVTVAHLRQGLSLGLDRRIVLQFLEVALNESPTNKLLLNLRSELTSAPAGPDASGNKLGDSDRGSSENAPGRQP